MKTIVYLHGACSTSVAFQYIRESLPEHRVIPIEYDYRVKLPIALAEIVQKIMLALPDMSIEVDIVSHSLGGIMALNVVATDLFIVNKVVTIATPFGGSEAASFLRFVYPFTQLFKEITPYAPFIAQTRRLATMPGAVQDLISSGRLMPIVTNIGEAPMHRGENDNVVTVESQMRLPDATFHQVNYNHFEVMQAPAVTAKIKEFLWQ